MEEYMSWFVRKEQVVGECEFECIESAKEELSSKAEYCELVLVSPQVREDTCHQHHEEVQARR